MAFPVNNVTCDILHYGSTSPDIAGLSIFLTEDFKAGHDAAIQTSTILRWTHLAYVGPTVDIRDAYSPSAPGNDALGSAADTLYVPSYSAFVGGTGTAFSVIIVARRGRGTASDHKRAFLQRNAINAWPNHNV